MHFCDLHILRFYYINYQDWKEIMNLYEKNAIFLGMKYMNYTSNLFNIYIYIDYIINICLQKLKAVELFNCILNHY